MFVISAKEIKKNQSKTISVLVQFAKDRRFNSMYQAKNEFLVSTMQKTG